MNNQLAADPSKLAYFAFGSNLSSRRLQQRLPEISIAGVAVLAQHQLCWHKNDQGQSGKCDIKYTATAADQVYGVIYMMTAAERDALDGYESEGVGYRRKQVTVVNPNAETIEAFTYFALEIDDTQLPYHWYKEHVFRGAIEHGFPDDYSRRIRNARSIDDPDSDRQQRELAIYKDLPSVL